MAELQKRFTGLRDWLGSFGSRDTSIQYNDTLHLVSNVDPFVQESEWVTENTGAIAVQCVPYGMVVPSGELWLVNHVSAQGVMAAGQSITYDLGVNLFGNVNAIFSTFADQLTASSCGGIGRPLDRFRAEPGQIIGIIPRAVAGNPTLDIHVNRQVVRI